MCVRTFCRRGVRFGRQRRCFGVAFTIVATIATTGLAYTDEVRPVNFAHDSAELSQRFPEATVETVSGGCVVVTPSAFAAPDVVVDPHFGGTFSRSIAVFAPRAEGSAKGLFRVVTVHHAPEAREQAQRTARLIGRLWSLYRARFGREVEFPLQADAADVYLTSETPPGENGEGGETRNDAIYVFGAGVAARSSLEWVRTIAHEWGHLTLAAARGYREPERDAAGYLGERLFLKWLRADETHRPDTAPDDGTTTSDLDLYYRRQIAPLIERYNEGGPGSLQLDGADTQAMDYYIGAVLATDDSFGSIATGRALYTVLSDHPRDFLVALRKNLADKSNLTVQRPVWLPLQKGTYRVASDSGINSVSVKESGWRTFAGAGAMRIVRVEGKPQ